MYRFVFCIIYVLSSQCVCAQSLQALYDNTIDSQSFQHIQLGFHLTDIESNRTLISADERKLFVPASSLKLITSLTAWQSLGPNFKFKTQVGYIGDIDLNGNLQGDLIIQGSGDPSFASEFNTSSASIDDIFKRIKTALLKNNISCVKGKIVIELKDLYKEPINPTWQYNDISNYYAAGCWGLNFNENHYKLSFNTQKPLGESPDIVVVSPIITKLKHDNQLIIDHEKSGDQAYIYGDPYQYEKYVRGTLPRGFKNFSIKGAIPNPPITFGQLLSDYLNENNIQCGDVHVNYLDEYHPIKVLESFNSVPLISIIQRCNFKSHNLYAEALYKRVQLLKRDKNFETIIFNQQKLIANTSELIMVDGSGLSTRNYVSPFFLTNFINAHFKQSGFETLTQLLPQGGVHGTVSSLFKNNPIKGHIWLKSGSMEGILSYAGIMQHKSGRWLSFCFIANGIDGSSYALRKKFESLMIDIYHADFPEH